MMVDSERMMRKKREEQRRRLKEWSDILDEKYPNVFVDADIKENMTGKHVPTHREDTPSGGSSLKDL